MCDGVRGEEGVWGVGVNVFGSTSWSLKNSPPNETVGVRLGRDMWAERGYCGAPGLRPDS